MGIFKKMMYASVVVAIIAICVGLWGYRAIFSPNMKMNTPYELYIPTGSDYDDVVSQLQSDDVLSSMSSFEMVAGMMKYKNIKSGKYIIEPNSSNRLIVQKLRAGQQEPVDLTLSQARTIADVAGKASVFIEADSSALLEALLDESFLEENGFSPQTIVSMIIPNTYQVYWNTSADKLRARMLSEYNKYWSANNRDSKREKLNMTRQEISALASIVEKESNLLSERPTIAGVYLNRLERGIALQADPTVVFAVQDFTIRRVLNKHLRHDSPYNTYMYPGLPPGPICMPSRSSIDAVLSPERHDYIFFCAKPGYDGAHSFARTNAEHSRNARIYHRWLTQEGIMK